jgi:hypothetical protein
MIFGIATPLSRLAMTLVGRIGASKAPSCVPDFLTLFGAQAFEIA